MVQWGVPSEGGMGLIPGLGTEIPHIAAKPTSAAATEPTHPRAHA